MQFRNLEDLRSIPEIEMLICSRNVISKENKPIFFYHIPKSAGISFKAALACAIRVKAFSQGLPLAKQDFRFDMYFSESYSIFSKSRIRTEVKLSHQFWYNPDNKYLFIPAWAPFGYHNKFGKEFNLVTIVREPYSRIVSRFRYLSWLKLLEYSEDSFIDFFRADPQINHQSKILSGNDNYSNSDNLKLRAMANLQYFHAYTTIDNTDTLLTQLLSEYNLTNVISKRLNVSPSWTIEIDFEKHKDEILSMNSQDVELYEYVKHNNKLNDYNVDKTTPVNDLTTFITTRRNRSWSASGIKTTELLAFFNNDYENAHKILKNSLGENFSD